MPAVQHGFELLTTTFEPKEAQQFLSDCQQQAVHENQSKIASFSVSISPVSPWAVLSALGLVRQRHFYYDPPQRPAMVGLGVVIGSNTSGSMRFEQAQGFINSWASRFIYADSKANSKTAAGHFFCSATFFDQQHDQPEAAAIAVIEPNHFEPAYVFVPKVQVTTKATSSVVTFNRLMTATTDVEAEIADIYRQLKALMATRDLGEARLASGKVVTKDVANFAQAVTAVLQQMKSGRLSHLLHKVVLADVMDVVAPQAVDVVRSLQTLRHNHPDCTVFSVGNGQGQSFIGASPERLLSITDSQLTTDALAGSFARGKTLDADAELAETMLNSEKERYEHQVVVEFITRQLRSLGLSPHHASAPQLLQLLHIQHLHTPITATLSSADISPLAILAKLHPTPAVAGLPRAEACQLIRQHETFDRGLYAAPLGWIDTQGNSEFIVGIRSALINGCKARLYAGAGIVSGSEPAKELAEIKLKLQTLLNALV